MRMLKPPLRKEDIGGLRAGEIVWLTGRVVTARDKAYVRALNLFRRGGKLPIDLEGGVIYNCGPLARRRGGKWEIVSAGPTTSSRMDEMQVEFIRRTGIRAVVGKGEIGKKVSSEFSHLKCVYLTFTGGAGVLAAQNITGVDRVIWPELGWAEAMWVLRVENFGPLVVTVDIHGRSLYK